MATREFLSDYKDIRRLADASGAALSAAYDAARPDYTRSRDKALENPRITAT